MSISLKNTGEAAVLIVNEDSLAGDEAMELKNRAVELLDSGIMNISLVLWLLLTSVCSGSISFTLNFLGCFFILT